MAHTKKWEERTDRTAAQQKKAVPKQQKKTDQRQPTPGWMHVESGMDGCEKELMCFGVNLYDYKWESTGQRVLVKDPLHGQIHEFPVTAVTINGQRRLFAFSEYCMCIFGLYAYYG